MCNLPNQVICLKICFFQFGVYIIIPTKPLHPIALPILPLLPVLKSAICFINMRLLDRYNPDAYLVFSVQTALHFFSVWLRLKYTARRQSVVRYPNGLTYLSHWHTTLLTFYMKQISRGLMDCLGVYTTFNFSTKRLLQFYWAPKWKICQCI